MARIIVIDDHEAARIVLRRALEAAGHEVREAEDGARGLQLLGKEGADLIITDIFMPGQDGIVTMRRLRSEFPGVKVIAISGGDATDWIDWRKGAALFGAVRSLGKPVAPADLVRAVEEALSELPPAGPSSPPAAA